MTTENLHEAIHKVLQDPRYTENVQKVGGLLKDQIDQPLERAVWHLEYLIRHPDLINFIKPRVHELKWYQYYMLDVVGFLVACLIFLGSLVFKLFQCCIGCFN